MLRGPAKAKPEDDDDGCATLIIADDGPGFDPTAVKSSMGSRLIGAMVQQLGGTFSYANSGERFSMFSSILARSQIGRPAPASIQSRSIGFCGGGKIVRLAGMNADSATRAMKLHSGNTHPFR